MPRVRALKTGWLLPELASLADAEGTLPAEPRLVAADLIRAGKITATVDLLSLSRMVGTAVTALCDQGAIVATVDDSNAFDPLASGWRVKNWRRVMKRRAHIPASLRQAVYARDGRRCLHCGADEHLSLDHIVPWSKGGRDDLTNLQTLCRSCNSSKGDR